MDRSFLIGVVGGMMKRGGLFNNPQSKKILSRISQISGREAEMAKRTGILDRIRKITESENAMVGRLNILNRIKKFSPG